MTKHREKKLDPRPVSQPQFDAMTCCPACGAQHRRLVRGWLCGNCGNESARDELGALNQPFTFFWDARKKVFAKNTHKRERDETPDTPSLTEIGEAKLEQMQKVWGPRYDR